jgi:prolyl-tRNA synthetase
MDKLNEKKEIVKKSVDLSAWYTDVILKAKLADYAPVKGCMVIRPYGYALWERIQVFLDRMIKDKGIENAYFPIFIPESFLQKEKEHVEGFAPEAAVVTIGGGEELSEKLIVRPTSETIMYEMYRQWTQSWRDLPILINQWCNVVRWEKRTYMFMRTSEFLWQEGHCAHTTHEESEEMVLWALEAYRRTYSDLLSLYGVTGVKSDAEKFAGASKTYTCELLMPDGKALQGGTSHDLGQNFAKVFDWTVLGEKGEKIYPWQNSWGLSTRSIGGLIMVHGDDHGLVLPPAVASVKVVINPVLGDGDAEVLAMAEEIKTRIIASSSGKFSGKVEIWGKGLLAEKTFGWRMSEAELKGVPIIIPLGKKEVAGEMPLSVNPRLKEVGSEKTGIEGVGTVVEEMCERIQKLLLERHKVWTEQNTREVVSFSDFKEIMRGKKGFIKAFWCESPECERKIKEETKATSRCRPIEAKEENGACVYCGKASRYRWIFAQSY